ncbi:Transmembrane protein like [Heracleum sosnowskyi]|uniref:Transmembrane protein like n=1 Tax=Heracleum sosnowskyi TaxID=360622 RepID=A0AAD8N1C3_9APIA|nr:Transmembrane protein like [Heracleum sosnowskyi]
MWGFGGKYYWGRREIEEKVEGLVVIYAWMSSEQKHVKSYVELFSSLGWNSLVCHSQFLNMFFPEKGASLASDLLHELTEELKVRPCPVVFASFSGGPKAIMCKVLQMIEENCAQQSNRDGYQLVRDSISGQIFDSTPVDFTTDLGSNFVLHPTILKISHPPRIVSWIAHRIKNALDTFFLYKLESLRAEYWQILYSTLRMRAPYLIFCSENDDLAPIHTICNFAQRLENLGADVKLVKWSNSSHVGHYKRYPVEYKAAVTELLGKATVIYSRRIRQHDKEEIGLDGKRDEVPKSLGHLGGAAMSSSQIFQRRVAPDMNDHFFVPISYQNHGDEVAGSANDEYKECYIPLTKTPVINVHGILGQALFDLCVPEDVDDWDIKPSSFLKNSPLNPIKLIRHSKL